MLVVPRLLPTVESKLMLLRLVPLLLSRPLSLDSGPTTGLQLLSWHHIKGVLHFCVILLALFVSQGLLCPLAHRGRMYCAHGFGLQLTLVPRTGSLKLLLNGAGPVVKSPRGASVLMSCSNCGKRPASHSGH